MTKTLRSCRHCGVELKDEASRFHVSGDTESNVVGDWCSIRHYLISRHGPDKAEEAYLKAFVPVARGHADADTLMQEEKITQ
jgi:hypothetical protein